MWLTDSSCFPGNSVLSGTSMLRDHAPSGDHLAHYCGLEGWSHVLPVNPITVGAPCQEVSPNLYDIYSLWRQTGISQ